MIYFSAYCLPIVCSFEYFTVALVISVSKTERSYSYARESNPHCHQVSAFLIFEHISQNIITVVALELLVLLQKVAPLLIIPNNVNTKVCEGL